MAVYVSSGGVVLTTNYWDCECDDNYIHSTNEERCLKCDTLKEDGPDSHAFEVLRNMYGLGKTIDRL